MRPPVQHVRREEVGHDAGARDAEHETAGHGLGMAQAQDASEMIHAEMSSSVAPLRKAARISHRRYPYVFFGVSGWPAEPGNEQRQAQRRDIGQHVAGVGEQRQRVGDDAAHYFDHEERAVSARAIRSPRVRLWSRAVRCGQARRVGGLWPWRVADARYGRCRPVAVAAGVAVTWPWWEAGMR